MDALKIASYGMDNWRHLANYLPTEKVYEEMRMLNSQYLHYISVLTPFKTKSDQPFRSSISKS